MKYQEFEKELTSPSFLLQKVRSFQQGLVFLPSHIMNGFNNYIISYRTVLMEEIFICKCLVISKSKDF